MKISLPISTIIIGIVSASAGNTFVATDAYRWQGDTIFQNEFKAYAESDTRIVSNYKSSPGFFMPIEQEWKAKNDLSGYPRLEGGNRLHRAIFNMGLDEMINAVENDTTLRTGKEWAGVWTRDVSYSIILSMAALQPEASMISLKKKVNTRGRIIQDTGSGGAWPVSTDRMVWALAAWELYKTTGSQQWLEFAYPVIRDSFEDDFLSVYSSDFLPRGETSFIDWREQSYPKWMQTADISKSEAMNTSVVHAAALGVAAKMASKLGKKEESKRYREKSERLKQAINDIFWMPKYGYYAMYRYGRDNLILNPREETLGESLAILYDIATSQQAALITENTPITPYGPAIFYPQIKDVPSYHNNALWPFVASFWTLANARTHNSAGTMHGIGSVFRAAALFATNKENLNLDNGDIFTELNSSNMLWSLSGNIAITIKVLFGMEFEPNGIRFSPFVPREMEASRTLSGFNYRGKRINISVEGYGNSILAFYFNGKKLSEAFVNAEKMKEDNTIRIILSSKPIAEMKINLQPNLKAPLTPQVRLTNISEGESYSNRLEWQPIEYIANYIVLCDGEPIATTRQTSFPAKRRGEWQVIGIDNEGIESFASEPVSNRRQSEFNFEAERDIATSTEISYVPISPIEGWRGNGFAETDHTLPPPSTIIDVPEDGEYSIAIRYANGNGPVNTENKCAIRTLIIDGKKAGTIVMPQRGIANWNDWGFSNSVTMPLKTGNHNLELTFNEENENMNLHTNHALVDTVVVTQMK